ncbi:MAG: LLM class flavin-dependent oxidoreductase [Dehalococcoidia bacterium]|nr:LLM class flavin-dependent oxidoreductase [Dehalococcoidia bacterium]
MAIKIDLRVPPCGPATEVADFVKQCEDAGFDGVGMLDSQLLERDIFVSMALAAQATEKIRISAAVLNPVTRHISVTASAAKTVAELAPGRIEFWIGRGFSSVQTIGVPPATVREMRRSVLDLKSILAGEEVSYNGAVSRMRHGNADMPPIYIAATGPRITKVAGEVADGVLLQVGIHPKSVEVARQHLEEGARRAGRDPKDLKIILCATTVIHDDQHEARELVRPMCVQRLMEGSHTRYLQAAGIDVGDLEIPAELNELYPDVIHAEDWERAKELCAFLPDDLLAQMCDVIGLVGTPEYCAQRLREAEANGIDHLYLMTSATYDYPHRELAAFKEIIFPALAAG